MYYAGEIAELKLYGVYDRNVQNLERVVFRAWSYSEVHLAKYFVSLGINHQQGGATPLYDNLCWLGEMVLYPDQWMFLYTGRGHDTTMDIPTVEKPLVLKYWNRSSLVFTTEMLVPMVLQISGVACDRSPEHIINPPAPVAIPDWSKAFETLKDMKKPS